MLITALTVAALSAATPVEPGPGPVPAPILDARLETLLGWFEGRFDNDAQVFFADPLGVPEDARHGRIHSIFRPVELQAIGEHVFYVEQYSNADPDDIYRQRLYVFSLSYETGEIRLDILAPRDADAIRGAHLDPSRLEGLSQDDLIAYPQCAVFWTFEQNQFRGATRRGECRVESRRSGNTLVIEDDLLLTQDAIWIRDRAETADGTYVYGNTAGIAHQLRRARPFQCWVAVMPGLQHGDTGEGASPSDWDFQRGVFIHDQGGRAQVTDSDGRTLELRLRDVVWPDDSRRPSLTLYVHEDGSDRATSYAWTEGGADRIGINLRWMQASCTHAPGVWGPSPE